MTSTNMMGKDEDLMAQVQKIIIDSEIDIPNVDTIKAIVDVRHGRKVSRAFSSVEELMKDLMLKI